MVIKKGTFTGADGDFKGKFQLAERGAIFLDEIGDMPIKLQTKLLRVLQDGEIEMLGSSDVVKTDIPVISATNKLPQDLIANGKFREDLYHRLNVFTITIPCSETGWRISPF